MGLVRLKVCGIKDQDHAQLAASLGADAVGFIFHPESPRFISEADAAKISRSLPPFVTPVGVFVRQTLSEVSEAVRKTGIRAVQLHGGPEFHPSAMAKEAVEFLGVPVIYALGAAELSDEWVESCREIDTSVHAALYLADSIRKGQFGGTGESLGLMEVKDASNRRFLSEKLMLAGGIRTANVGEILEKVRPYALDVSSGLEREKGMKDSGMMRDFFRLYRDERWRDDGF